MNTKNQQRLSKNATTLDLKRVISKTLNYVIIELFL